MPKNKTTETEKNPADFLKAVPDESKRKDSQSIAKLFQAETGFKPKMWGPSIVGFGSYHYVYESGREGDMPLVAFSPRKDAIVLYLSAELEGREELLKKFGKHTTGKGCIYIKKLEDVDVDILKKMVTRTVKYRMNNTRPKFQSAPSLQSLIGNL